MAAHPRRGEFRLVDGLGREGAHVLGGVFPEEEDAKPSKFDEWLEKKLGSEKMEKAVISFSVVLGVLFSVGLFFLLPTLISGLFDRVIHSAVIRSLIEGVIRIAIFMGYMILISKMKDMKRVFSYHGAEHKTIRCYEAQLPPDRENCRGMTRLHPRAAARASCSSSS